MIRLLSVNLLSSPLEEAMIDRRTVFKIHRLNNLGFSKRKIACELGLDRNTVKKYPEHPQNLRPVAIFWQGPHL